MTNVVINGLTAVHAGSNGILTTTDICKTPPLCPQIPYTNIAKSSDSAMTATSVLINGNPACTLKSNFAISNGDSPGNCGGTNSGTVNGMAEFLNGSPNVFIEGVPVVRQTDLMVSNFKNTPPMPLQQTGAGKPPDVSALDAVQLEVAELPFVVDMEVAGKELTLVKSIVGAVDLDLTPEDEEGEAAVLEEIIFLQNTTAQDPNASTPDPNAIRDFKVLSVTGATSGKVGDSLKYKVTKTDLDDVTDAELKTISWKLILNDKKVFENGKDGKKVLKKGKVLKTFLNKGPNFTLKVDKEINAYCFMVVPYTDAPPKEPSSKRYVRTTIIGKVTKLNEETKKIEIVRQIKPLKNVQFLVVHHTAGNKNAKRDDIEKIHLNKGWDQIGYHKVIEFNGDIVQGRPEKLRGAHTKSVNWKSLGVNVVGNFENIKPQSAQITSLVKVLTAWCKKHKLKSSAIYGHFETPGAKFDLDEVTKLPKITLCPGANLKNQLSEIRKKVAANLA